MTAAQPRLTEEQLGELEAVTNRIRGGAALITDWHTRGYLRLIAEVRALRAVETAARAHERWAPECWEALHAVLVELDPPP